MKSIALSIFMLAVTAAAQQPPPHPGPPMHPPSALQQPTILQPKESVASLKLELDEQKQENLQQQQQMIIQQAQQQIARIGDQLTAEGKELEEAQAEVKKENGWGEDVVYVAPQQIPGQPPTPGHWQKTPKK